LKQRILIVEDNPANRELLQDWLEIEGYEVWCAADLEASYEVLGTEPPDVVLLDINLGAENGLDLVAWMRRKTSLDSIPVIAVTAHALATEQERILQAGCVACLSKPIDFKDLREQLRRWLQYRTVSRQHS
jgi:two-component system, cell cycle response regulator DivK